MDMIGLCLLTMDIKIHSDTAFFYAKKQMMSIINLSPGSLEDIGCNRSNTAVTIRVKRYKLSSEFCPNT